MPDLRAIRKQLGLTQAELAVLLGVSRKTISEREAGKVPITRETELAMRYLVKFPDAAAIALAVISDASDRGPDDLDRPSRL